MRMSRYGGHTLSYHAPKILRNLVWSIGLIAPAVLTNAWAGYRDGPSKPVQRVDASISYIPSEKFANGIFGSLVYSADSKILAAAAGDGTVRLYDAVTAQERSVLKMKGSATGLRASANIWTRSPEDQMLLMNNYASSELQLVDFRTGQPRVDLERSYKEANWVRCVACSPDGRLIAGGYGNSGEVVVWDAATGKRRFKTPAHIVPPQTDPFPRAMQPIPAPIYSLAFTPDASLLLSSSIGAPLRCWDVATGAEVDPPVRIAVPGLLPVSPGGKLLMLSDRVGVGNDFSRRYMLYDMTTWEKRSQWVGAGGPVQLALLDNGRSMLWMEDRRFVQLRDAHDGRVLSKLDVEIRGGVDCMAVSPDGKRIAVGGCGVHPMFGEIRLIEVEGTTLRLWSPKP